MTPATEALPFQDRLASMLAKEAASAGKAIDRAERMGDMIEAIARGLGFTVAIAANGNAQTIDTMIAGAERYALEEAAEKAPFAQFMAMARRAPPATCWRGVAP